MSKLLQFPAVRTRLHGITGSWSGSPQAFRFAQAMQLQFARVLGCKWHLVTDKPPSYGVCLNAMMNADETRNGPPEHSYDVCAFCLQRLYNLSKLQE